MAIPVVPAWSLNDPVTSTKLQQGSTALSYLLGGGATGKPFCKLGNSVAQTIANNTATALTWDTEIADARGMHSTGTNPTRVTGVEPGFHRVTISSQFQASATGYREMWLRVSGSAEEGGIQDSGLAAELWAGFYSNLVYFNGTTDYVEVMVQQTSGGNLDTGLARFNPRLTVSWESLL